MVGIVHVYIYTTLILNQLTFICRASNHKKKLIQSLLVLGFYHSLYQQSIFKVKYILAFYVVY